MENACASLSAPSAMCGSDENRSAVCNSSDSSALTHEQLDGGDDDSSMHTDTKKSKKHSGPRKRRPKKKGAAIHSDATVAAVSVCDAASPTLPPIGDTAPRSDGSAADEIEALLQKELARTAAAFEDSDIPTSPSCARSMHSSQHTDSPHHLRAASPSYVRHRQQQHQQLAHEPPLALADIDFSLPQRESFGPQTHHHRRQYHHHHHYPNHSHTQPAFPPSQSPSYTLHSPFAPPLPPSPAPPLPPTPPPPLIESSGEHDRSYWTKWVIEAAEKERARRLNVLKQLQQEEEEEIQRRRKWAIEAIEREQEAMMREMFLDNMKNTQWFQSTISRLADDYEVVCPNSWFGCMVSCMLRDLETHLESCVYRQVPDTLDQAGEDSLGVDFYSYDVVCPNAVLGCNEICSRENLAAHLAACPVNGISREKEWEERLEGRRHVLQATEEERARRVSEQQIMQRNRADSEHRFSFGHLQQLYEEQTATMQVVLHDEIVDFCEQQTLEAQRVRPWIERAVTDVTRAIRDLWSADATHVEGYGSFATQLHSGYSDVDLVVFGVAGANGQTCQQCVSALAAHFAASPSGCDFVEISAITKASVPLLKAVVLVPMTPSGSALPSTGSDAPSDRVLRVPFDITFDDPTGLSHNGIASASLISTLAQHFYGLRELALVLKYFLVKRGGNDPYVGGLSSYGLLLMIIYVLQEQSGAVSEASLNETDGQAIAQETAQDLTTDAASTTAKPVVSTEQTQQCDDRHSVSARCEAQRRKGESVAQEIIRQSLARQQRRAEQRGGSSSRASTTRLTRRPHLPSMLASASDDRDASALEPKPFLLGKYLMDFLQFFGNDFRQHVDAIDVTGRRDAGSESGETVAAAMMMSPTGSSRSSLASPPPPLSMMPMSPPAPPLVRTSLSPPPSITCSPPPPLPPSAFTLSMTAYSPSSIALSPQPSQEGLLMICDPLQPENNVGKSCYRVSQVCRDFSDFLSFLTALIVRGSVMTTGKKTKKTATMSAELAPHAVMTNGSGDCGNGEQPTTVTRSPLAAQASLPSPLTTPPAHPQTREDASPSVRTTSHRILTSVFEMKTRDTRASIDLST